MAKRPDLAYVADLSNRLMKAKADVKRLQIEWDALFQPGPTEPSNYAPVSNVPLPETNVSRIIKFLGERIGQSFTAAQVSQALGMENKQSTATTLSKLVKAGRIRKEGVDQYASCDSPIEPRDLGLIDFEGEHDTDIAERHHVTVPLSHNRKA